MSNEIKVTVKAREVELLHWFDLSEDDQAEFDYVSEEEKCTTRFFLHEGSVWDVCEFLKDDSVKGYEATYPLTAFSALAIKLVNDNEAVDIALLH